MPNLEVIEEFAFSNCKSLINVEFYKLKQMDGCAFLGCDKLTHFKANNLVTMGTYAF